MRGAHEQESNGMMDFLAKIKIFPMLFCVALIALGARTNDVIVGFEMLTPAAVAAAEDAGNSGDAKDTANENADNSETRTPNATETKKSDSDVSQPTMIGVPSNEEMELLSQLRKRREDLDRREQQIDLQSQLLSSTEKRINDKILQLQTLEGRIKEHLRLFEEREATQLASIVKVYETMKAKEAAPRFEALKLQTQLDLVSRMKPSKVAALMAKMSTRGASRLTTELATLAAPPAFEDVDGGRR